MLQVFSVGSCYFVVPDGTCLQQHLMSINVSDHGAQGCAAPPVCRVRFANDVACDAETPRGAAGAPQAS